MSKNLWDKERDSLFRDLTLSYQEEGFSLKESRRLAKQETEDILSNSLDFVEDVITTGGSVREVMAQVIKHKGIILGVGVMVDRSNGSVALHPNQFSIVAMEAKSYGPNEVPESLSAIPVQKPGSRKIV